MSQRLKELARKHAASPYMVAIALLGLLVYRYCGERDVCIGSPSATRDRPELAALVGHFTNVLVLRMKVDPAAGFVALLSQVRERVLEAKSHQDLPLDMLVEALALERTPGLHPLFQIKSTQQAAGAVPADPAAAAHGIGVDEVHFDLSFDLVDTGSALSFVLAYAADIFDHATIERLADALRSLAGQVAADPARALAATQLAGDSSLRGECASSPADNVLSLFDQAAARRGGATALSFGDRAHSFDELARAAGHWAAELESRGIGAEQRVAVCMERTPEFVLAVLSVLKAGGAYVPIDPTLPQQRIDELLADCGAALVLVSGGKPRQAALPCMRVGFDVPGGFLPHRARAMHPAQAAYLIYTSGSTGRPKGVVVHHGALANYVQGVLARLALPEGELRDGLHRRGGSWPYLVVRCAVLGWCAAPRLERGGLRSRCVCGPHGEDARRRAEDRAQPPEGPAERAARGRGAAVARARAGRRGDGRGNAAGHSRAAAGPAHLQPLWADRDRGRHADACRAGAGWRYRQPAPGQADREHGRLGARRRIAARAARHGGRALHRGCRRGARLSFARRSLRRSLRCLALRRRAAHLPCGRPRAPAQRRHAGVSRPQR